MFLRSNPRKKDGKIHRYWSIVENIRTQRGVYHSVRSRVEAHIFVCFLTYCLHVTLCQELRGKAPGLTPRVVLETLATVQILSHANIESWANNPGGNSQRVAC